MNEIPKNYVLVNGEWCHPSRVKSNAGNLGAGGTQELQRTQVETLVAPKPRQKRNRKCVGTGVLRVSIVSFRRGELDNDNLVAGAKPLRDAISKSLGIDDADERVEWACDQCKTKHQTGTLVKIEILK